MRPNWHTDNEQAADWKLLFLWMKKKEKEKNDVKIDTKNKNVVYTNW
jgi:hypothetical protein